MRTVTTLVLTVLVFISGAFFSPAMAQVLFGSIVGQVSDTSGAGVPDANVRITHRETNQSREAVTTASGDFNFPSLAGGTYDVTVTRQGFQTFHAKGINVATGQVARVDAALRIGAISETVLVSADALVLQTDRAEVRTEVSSTQLNNLPTPLGRNYENLPVTV